MKLFLSVVIIVAIISVLFIVSSQKGAVPDIEQNIQLNKSLNMKIQSPAFEHNELIPPKYTCDGEDISPPLTFSDIPGNTKSLALINDDPDATNGTWVHWTMWNISPDIKEIAENSVPSGAVQGITSFGVSGFGGSCPPSGTHRYFFKLYALDTMLDLPVETDANGIESAMQGHIIEQAELIGLYKRQ